MRQSGLFMLAKQRKKRYNKQRNEKYKCIVKGDMDMSKKPTVLMILDGYGLRADDKGNAVAEGKLR